MNLLRLTKVFQEHFTLTRNIQQSRGEFFWAQQQANETPEHRKKTNCKEIANSKTLHRRN